MPVAELGDVLQPVLLQRHQHLVLLQGSQPAGGQGTPGLLLLRKERPPLSISLILILFLLHFCLCFLSISVILLSLYFPSFSLWPLSGLLFSFFLFLGMSPLFSFCVSSCISNSSLTLWDSISTTLCICLGFSPILVLSRKSRFSCISRFSTAFSPSFSFSFVSIFFFSWSISLLCFFSPSLFCFILLLTLLSSKIL